MRSSKSLAFKLKALEHPVAGITLYNLLHRNSGWGIQYWEEHRVTKDSLGKDNWASGLVVYKYYPTLNEAVSEEYKRFYAKKAA